MKSFSFSTFFSGRGLALAGLMALAPGALASERENVYDQLSATLLPIAQVFTPKGEYGALRATLVLESMTGLPSEQAWGRLELAVEPPGRALLRGSFGARDATLVRVGQKLLLSPSALKGLFPVEAPKKTKKKQKGLEPLVLPFPPEQIALLPVLFTVTERAVDGPPGVRVLEVRLMPELAASISQKHPDAKVADWTGQLTLRDGRLERLELSRPGWSVAVRVEGLELSKKLPMETWRPSGTQDAVMLEGPEARLWLNAVGRFLNDQGDRLRQQGRVP